MDIYTGADLLKVPEGMTLIDRFGRFGFDLFRRLGGFPIVLLGPIIHDSRSETNLQLKL